MYCERKRMLVTVALVLALVTAGCSSAMTASQSAPSGAATSNTTATPGAATPASTHHDGNQTHLTAGSTPSAPSNRSSVGAASPTPTDQPASPTPAPTSTVTPTTTQVTPTASPTATPAASSQSGGSTGGTTGATSGGSSASGGSSSTDGSTTDGGSASSGGSPTTGEPTSTPPESTADTTSTDESSSNTSTDDTRTAQVTDVVDGDTVRVEYADSSTGVVDLAGVDAPNLGRGSDPADFEGVPETAGGQQYLYAWAWAASGTLSAMVEGETVEVRTLHSVSTTSDEHFSAVDSNTAQVAYVTRNGTSVNQVLLQRGLARATDTDHPLSSTFVAAEQVAMEENRGLWDGSTGLFVP